MSNELFHSSDIISNSELCGHLQAFKYLINTSEKIKDKETMKQDYYLAHNAAASGNLNLLKWTLKNTKCKVTDQDVEGLTILHVAALASNFNIVEWVLKSTHLSPVVRTEEGSTALHFACWSGNVEITKLLIQTEPRLINMRMTNGTTAAMYATQGGFVDIMEFLLNEGGNFGLPTINGVNCLHMAAKQGHLEAVKWLVENTGLRLNGKDDNGITPIHYAAVNNRHDVVSWLLEKEVRLLKERFITDYNNSPSSVVSLKSMEDLVNTQSNLSIKKICDFSSLESVQDKLSMILSEYNANQINKKMEDEVSGVVQCCIPISVLLLLQSALVDLRLQYQNILHQSYKSNSPTVDGGISEETQTIEIVRNDNLENSSFIFRKSRLPSSAGSHEIPRPIINNEMETNTSINDSPIPPPPPTAPPTYTPMVPDSPIVSFGGENGEGKNGKRQYHHRRTSSSDDIKISLIEELKKINNLRLKNNPPNEFHEDNDSCTSNTDSSSLNDNSLYAKGLVRNSITDSAPNLVTMFNASGGSSTALVPPKWKVDIATKQNIQIKQKEEDMSNTSNDLPYWKRQIIEKRVQSSAKIEKEISTINESVTPTNGSISPCVSKVSQLVSQWQYNNV